MCTEAGSVVEIGKMPKSIFRTATFAIFERGICVIFELWITLAGNRFVAQPTRCISCAPAQRDEHNAQAKSIEGGSRSHLCNAIVGLRPWVLRTCVHVRVDRNDLQNQNGTVSFRGV